MKRTALLPVLLALCTSFSQPVRAQVDARWIWQSMSGQFSEDTLKSMQSQGLVFSTPEAVLNLKGAMAVPRSVHEGWIRKVFDGDAATLAVVMLRFAEAQSIAGPLFWLAPASDEAAVRIVRGSVSIDYDAIKPHDGPRVIRAGTALLPLAIANTAVFNVPRSQARNEGQAVVLPMLYAEPVGLFLTGMVIATSKETAQVRLGTIKRIPVEVDGIIQLPAGKPFVASSSLTLNGGFLISSSKGILASPATRIQQNQ